jgi:chromosome segregation ATPase
VEKEEHQETKIIIKKYKEQIEDLEEKLKDANKKLSRHQDVLERFMAITFDWNKY